MQRISLKEFSNDMLKAAAMQVNQSQTVDDNITSSAVPTGGIEPAAIVPQPPLSGIATRFDEAERIDTAKLEEDASTADEIFSDNCAEGWESIHIMDLDSLFWGNGGKGNNK